MATSTPQKPAPSAQKASSNGVSSSQVASLLTDIVDRGFVRVSPVLDSITAAINEANSHKATLDEHALVDKVRPLIREAIAILNQTLSQVNAADFGGTVAVAMSHPTIPEEVTLAHSLSRLTETVMRTIEAARSVIRDMPSANGQLTPLLNLLQEPLFQILTAVGMLLTGVLNLVGRLLSTVGLGWVLAGILRGLGLDTLLKAIGLDFIRKSLLGGN